jgi:pyruvate formate lyase activating enzyme
MIAGLEPCSFSDFPGHLSAVAFTQGCNLRCRYCHNPQLCPISNDTPEDPEGVLRFLAGRQGCLDGLVVSGGEPTLHEALPGLLEPAASLGFLVKLDTNGTRPHVVRRLAVEGLLDYVAVDVKLAPGTSSLWLCGLEGQAERALATLRTLVELRVPCEARTTVTAGHHSLADLESLARALSGAGVRTWRVQPVSPRRVLDPSIRFTPPEPSVLREAAATARRLGIDVVPRTLAPGRGATDAERRFRGFAVEPSPRNALEPESRSPGL